MVVLYASIKMKLSVSYHPTQYKMLTHKAKKKTVPKGRRWGFTQGCMNWSMEIMAEGLSPVLWVDTINTNIDRYVERYALPVLNNLPQSLWKWRQQKKELNVMGSVMDLRSADTPENIEGFGYKLIILNEAGIILRNQNLYYNTILPMFMDFDPDSIIGGTPKGRNIFQQLSNHAADPLNENEENFHHTSYDNPLIQKSVIDQIASEMPELVRKQEIFATFLEDEAVVFRNVKECATATAQRPIPGKVYYMGVDLGKLVDFTTIHIFNEFGIEVHTNRFNQLDWGYQKKVISETAKEWNDACLLLDSSGLGDPIFDDLKKIVVNIDGYKFTNESKRKLIEALMLAFEMKEIQIINDPVAINELLIFEYEISKSGTLRYNAPEGSHDDHVIGIALANWCRQKQPVMPWIATFNSEAVNESTQ